MSEQEITFQPTTDQWIRQSLEETKRITDTCVCVITSREPPVKTLLAYQSRLPTIILADPKVFAAHVRWFDGKGPEYRNVMVAMGAEGMSAQVAECYKAAWEQHFKWYFRLDDDLYPKYFVMEEAFPPLDSVIYAARLCALYTKTSLAGFMNTSRTDWFGEGYGRSYGLIHGGAHICCSAQDPEEFIDVKLRYYEDVYRSASHRLKDGAVGRVKFIGLDKTASLRDSTTVKDEALINHDKKIILGKFPDLVTCKATRSLDKGRQVIPNWRMKKHSGYIK